MNGVKERLDYLIETKSEIKQAIIDTGEEVQDGTIFREYPNKIQNLIDTTIISQSDLDKLVESAKAINGTSQYTLKSKYLIEDNIISYDSAKTYSINGSNTVTTTFEIEIDSINTNTYEISLHVSDNKSESDFYFKLVDSKGKIVPYPVFSSSGEFTLFYDYGHDISAGFTASKRIQSATLTNDVKYIVFATSINLLNSMFNM